MMGPDVFIKLERLLLQY